MKASIKGLNVTVNMTVAVKGDFEIEPSQAQELAHETYKGCDIAAGVEVAVGLEEASVDVTPDEVKACLDALLESSRHELEARIRKEELRYRRDELAARKSEE